MNRPTSHHLVGALLLFALSVATGGLVAQSVYMHQATKTLEKTFSFQPGYMVNVEGNKAQIMVNTHNRPEVQVRLELIAQHPDSSLAVSSVNRWKHMMTRHGKNIYLRNYLSDGYAQEADARLSARYFILVPAESPVYVKNQYGQTEVNQLRAPLRVQGRFTEVRLEDIVGAMELVSQYGLLTGQQLEGEVTLDAERSDVIFRQVSGTFDLNLSYGSLLFAEAITLNGLNINAEQTVVHLDLEDVDQYALTVTADRSEFQLPQGLRFLTLKEQPGGRTMQYVPRTEHYPGITIRITLGSIQID